METESKATFKPDPKLKLMDHVHQVLRHHHYVYRTEQAFCNRTIQHIKFHGSKTHPARMGKTQIVAFLNHLATHGRVSASTQQRDLNAAILRPLRPSFVNAPQAYVRIKFRLTAESWIFT